MAEPRLTDAYRVDGVLTTVDAVNGLATLSAHREAGKQVAVADRLLVTKADLASTNQLEQLFLKLFVLNPTANVILSREGDAPAAALIGVGLEAGRGAPAEIVDWFERASHAPGRPRVLAEAHDSSRDATCGDPHCANPHHGHRHDEDITTFSIIIDDPVEWGAFRRWLEYLAMLKGEDLLRFKGLIHIAERPDTPIVVHGVQHVFHPPRELAAWPSADRRTRLVFVTRGISRTLIEYTLSKFAAIDVARIRRPAA
jgi:G3E family GTPase